MIKIYFFAALLIWISGVCNSQQSVVYDATLFGAKGDSITLDTKSIQSAIDKCNLDGGGKVYLKGGKFRSGTLYLKSNVTLQIESGAVLFGSTNIGDYTTDTHKMMYKNEPFMNRCLIFAKDAVSIAIEGPGVIDGQGFPRNFPKERPLMIRFLNCKNIHLKNISLKDPAAWTTAWLYCSDIVVDDVKISSRANFNGDGLDFDGCQNIRVSNCLFDTSDDAVCLQTSKPDYPCSNVLITNCIFHSKWAGIRIGLLSRGDIESVTVSNCVFSDIEDSGLKIQMNEGAVMKNMVFTNLLMKNVPRPIFMTHCQQRACVDSPEELAPMKTMRGFLFDNILVESDKGEPNSVIILSGMPGYPIEDVTFSNIQMITPGGGTSEDASRRILNEFTAEVLKGWWPEVSLIGTVPSYGMYARHIKGLTINNAKFSTIKEDFRPAIVFDDVAVANLTGLQLLGKGVSESVFRFQNVRESIIRDCYAPGDSNSFIQVEGDKTQGIYIDMNNYFAGKKIVNRRVEVNKESIIMGK